MLMHPNSRPTHCAPIRDALDDGFDPPGVGPAARLKQACELRYWNTLNEICT